MIYIHITDLLITFENIEIGEFINYFPNYKSFILNLPNNKKYIGIPIMNLLANQSISIPSDAVFIDQLDINYINSDFYQSGENTYIKTQFKEKRYIAFANHDWSIFKTNIQLKDNTDSILFNFFLLNAFGIFASFHNAIKLHASVIEKNGDALLFLGPSGTGKSTHSQLWLEHIEGSSLLNDDEPFVRIMDDGEIRVYGAPWSGSTNYYRNEWAKVKGFVWLQQYSENKLQKLTALDGFSLLLQSASVLRSSKEVKNNISNTILRILENLPVHQLQCLPDEGAVRLTEQIMIQ